MTLKRLGFRIGLLSFLLLALLYFLGPTPPKPMLQAKLPHLVSDKLDLLEQAIYQEETRNPLIKPDNQARVVWANPKRPQKTAYSIVYLHGFSASQGEGSPVHTALAKHFGCNLYLARLAGHGIDTTDAFANLSAGELVNSALKAVAIGKTIGDKVILVGTSTGAALAMYIAAHQPDIAAIIAYSPIVDFYASATVLLDKPWGLQLSRFFAGGKYLNSPNKNKYYLQYWTSKYRLEGAVMLKTFLVEAMHQKTFAQIKQPFFLAYYYKSEQYQDKVVSVPAMLQMYNQLGTPTEKKRKHAFPDAGHHVIASQHISKDWEAVLLATQKFCSEVLKMEPKKSRF